MMSPVTVVITNYARPDNVHLILSRLLTQTVRPEIFIWDNSPTEDSKKFSADWIVKSSLNSFCAPRWWMAGHAVTDFVLVLDDDLSPKVETVLADTLRAAHRYPESAVGATGVELVEGLPYAECLHFGLKSEPIYEDRHVDIIKGRFLCAPTAMVRSIDFIGLDAEDDIAVSAMLTKRSGRKHVILKDLQGSLDELPQGPCARKNRAVHSRLRDRARVEFFPPRNR